MAVLGRRMLRPPIINRAGGQPSTAQFVATRAAQAAAFFAHKPKGVVIQRVGPVVPIGKALSLNASVSAAIAAHRPKGLVILRGKIAFAFPNPPVAKQFLYLNAVGASVKAHAPRGLTIIKNRGGAPGIGKLVTPGNLQAKLAADRYHKPLIFKPILLGLIKFAVPPPQPPIGKQRVVGFAARQAAIREYLQRFPPHDKRPPVVNPSVAPTNAKPYLPRIPSPNDSNFFDRMRRFSELLSIMINSLTTSGQIVQEGPNTFVITGSAATPDPDGLTGTFP